MGMFDLVSVGEPPVPCPVCKEPLGEWQSKDGDCELETIPWQKTNLFYTWCEGCSAWIQYTRVEAPESSERFPGFVMFFKEKS